MKFAEMEQTIEALSQQTHNMGQLRNQNNALQVWLGPVHLTGTGVLCLPHPPTCSRAWHCWSFGWLGVTDALQCSLWYHITCGGQAEG